MAGEKLRKLLAGDFAEYFPAKTAELFPRIVSKLEELWGKPELDDYFAELLIMDKTRDRQGFPLEIVTELFSLSSIYDKALSKASQDEDIWAMDYDSAKKQLESKGVEITPRTLAKCVEQGNIESVALLLASAIPVDTRDAREWTMLTIASFEGKEEVAKLLINRGADVYAQDRGGYSPIHWASYKGYARVVELLINKKANVNSASTAGITPLMQAAAMGHREVVKVLLEHGAYPSQATQDGQTAISKARANKHYDIADLLEKGPSKIYTRSLGK